MLSISYELHLAKLEVLIFLGVLRCTQAQFEMVSRSFPVETCVIYASTDRLTYCIGAPVLQHLIGKIFFRMVSVISHHEVSYIAK